MFSETDVIIIGAGCSGLAAAKELSKLGLSYTVIEGSHRIGGRAYSEEIAPGVWFDLGCSYLHQAQNNPLVAIADQLGITIGKDKSDLLDYSKQRYHRNGMPLSRVDCASNLSYIEDCNRAINEAADRNEDVVVVDLIDLDSEFSVPFMHMMAEGCTLDIDQLSSMDMAVFGEGSNIPVLNGYGNLIAIWGADVPVSLDTRADRINWSGKTVSVETPKGALHGRKVLVTVSTGILASGEIEFAAGLPDWKMQAVMSLPTGTENKICLHFDRDVFGSDGRGYHNTWNSKGDTGGFEASIMGQNTTISFVGGRFAIWLEKKGAKAAEQYAIDRVSEVFGNDIRKHVSRSIVTAWTTEPWTRGSFSWALPGQAHQRSELARPLDEKLFFAGEATTITDHSCCHGAFSSGIRATHEIAETLN
ncbi:MAG: monoamine oxidase [Parasphingorhabdus sp.]|jgi:monoamine oxidase